MPVTTQHEQSAVLDGQEWMSSLPQETQLKTLSTQILKENLVTRNPTEISVAFTNCVEQEAWTKVAYMPSVKSKRKVLEYKSAIEWLRDCLGVELDQLMRSIAGYQPNAKEASEAVTVLLELIGNEEPSTLKELCDDYKFGDANMIGWQRLLEKLQEIDPVWAKAKNRLDDLIKAQLNISIENNCSETNEELNNKSQKKRTYLPKDSRSCLIRSLTKLKKSPLLCKSRNTTTEKVDRALNRLLRGLTSVAEAKREAGLIYVYKLKSGISLRGIPKDVAKKILKTVGKESAALIAYEILKEVK
tara:strand:- start:149 stop:1054 length:906 start_codon:yes stop_codon:yes gene_type:complete